VIKKTDLDEDELEMLYTEIDILSEMDHPNIIKLYEYFEDESRFYLVTDLCKGGELFDDIVKKTRFREWEAALIMKSLLSALCYLHNKGIIHRDIKLENVLLEFSKDNDTVKLIDFGTARRWDIKSDDDEDLITEKIGTPYYIAPEVLNKNYNSKCDVWSAGVIAYTLIGGSPPFNGQTDQDIMKAVKDGRFDFRADRFRRMTPPCEDFICKLLTYDFRDRPTAQKMLQHKWLTERDDFDPAA
jgi:calcium-dependent protein kinase